MASLYFSRRIHAEGFTPQPIDPVSDQDKKAFLKACKSGNFEAVKVYCEQHPKSVNVQDAHGKSGLMLAAGSGAFKVVEYLANVPGYVVGMEDENWENALFYAARANSAKIVDLFFKKKMSFVVNKQEKYPTDVLTTETPNQSMLKQLGDAKTSQEKLMTLVSLEVIKRIAKDPDGCEKYIAEAEEVLGRKLVYKNMSILSQPEDEVLLELKERQKTVLKSLRASVAEDQTTQRKVLEFFRAHPPTSIEAARQTVFDRFGIKPTLDSLKQLLTWGKIEFKKGEKKDDISEEVD